MDRLYLRAEVFGRWGADGERSWRYGDGFQVSLSPDAANAGSPRFVTLGFSVVDGSAHPVLVNRNGRWFLQNNPPGVQLKVTPPAGDVGAVYDMAIELPGNTATNAR